jgi:glycosyltransferase involved in cell wall biosynthesis
MSKSDQLKRIAFLLPDLSIGGAQRIAVNLLKGFENLNIPLDLVVASSEGLLAQEISSNIRLVNLNVQLDALRLKEVARTIVPLKRYLQEEKPKALIAHFYTFNIVATIACKLAQFSGALILVEHTSHKISYEKNIRSYGLREKILPLLRSWTYPWASHIIAVSKGLAQDLEVDLRLPRGKIKVIYNPVISEDLLSKAAETVSHRWFPIDKTPVILAVGRFAKEKDYKTLIRAFAQVRLSTNARLIILGDGPERPQLINLIHQLELDDSIDMPGFVSNPYAYISRSSLLVISSYREGLPTVLIESLALETPVVSTDCPNGPTEILDNGKYGLLVPVGDSSALAEGILKVFSDCSPRVIDEIWIKQFYVTEATQKYLELID